MWFKIKNNCGQTTKAYVVEIWPFASPRLINPVEFKFNKKNEYIHKKKNNKNY